MGEKRKLSIANFLKILPIRNKKIDAAASDEPKPLASYKPNRLAMVLHPGRQALKVAAVADVSEDVRLYTLVPDREAGTESLAPFGAGKYLSVFETVNGMPVNRAYSISSSPKQAVEGVYELTVRRVDDGLVSAHIHNTWQAGTPVEVSAPAG
ncbi:MAG: oxidoreductase, partial [Clostridia bacterium]|nr:oxidoreductase [Clostridia bacterium]